MFEQIAQYGIGATGLAIAAKMLWPILKSSIEANSARSDTDTKIHTLYQEALERIDKLSEKMSILTEELGKARVEIANLNGKVEGLTRDLDDAQKALSKYQENHHGS